MIEWHKTQPPTPGRDGYDTHPAYGSISASRVTSSPPNTLFDSEIRHSHYIVLHINRASIKRDLNHNWIHPDITPLIEVAMSEAQWAAFISSMNSGGSPCTITSTENDHNVPGLEFRPVLAQSIAEVRGAAQQSMTQIERAMENYSNVLVTGTAKEKREALSSLQQTIKNVPANMAFVAKSLSEHAENVVTKARADVEAMVVQSAQQLGINASELPTLELKSGE